MDLPLLALGMSIGIATASAFAMFLIFAIDELNHKRKIKQLATAVQNV